MILFQDSFPATLDALSQARRKLARRLSELRISTPVIDDLTLGLSEAMTNIVAHGAPVAETISLSIALVGANLQVTLEDDGGSYWDFNDAILDADLIRIRDFEETGRGLSLIASAFDRVHYEPGAPNRLTAARSLRPVLPTVLIVEDDGGLLDLYAHYLKRYFKTFKASSIEDALDLLSNESVDVILSDVNLGDGEGTALLRDAQREDNEACPAVVLMSGAADHEARQAALELGAEFFIAKPAKLDEIRQKIELALTRVLARRARLARFFAGAVQTLLVQKPPEKLRGFSLSIADCAASVGGGDLILRNNYKNFDQLLLVDVMGHGVGAKAWSIAFAAIVRMLGRLFPGEPGDRLLTRLAEIAWNDPVLESSIATVAVVDLWPDGMVGLSCAGHPPPNLVTSSDQRVINIGGPLLGVLEPARYTSEQIMLADGERLILVTDGVEPSGACVEKAPDWIAKTCSGRSTPGHLIQRLSKAGEKILGIQPKDDWTILVIERAR